MQRIRTVCAVAGLMISGMALGQGGPQAASAANGPASEVQGAYARVKANLIKAADKMPAITGTHRIIFNVGALLLGAVMGLASAGLSRMMYAFEDMFEHLHVHWMWWPALGGIGIGVGGLFFPRGLGVGYDNIAQLLRGQATIGLIVGLIIAKSLMLSLIHI